MSGSVIIGAARTPIGSFLGGLSRLSATELGALALKEAVRRSGIPPADFDEVILGHVLSAGVGQAPARQAALAAGFPPSVGAFLVNKVCGSGMKAAMLADQAIRAGDASIIVAGGMESMSNAPYLLSRARTGYRLGHGELLDSLLTDGLWDPWGDYHMGSTGELVARERRISRERQDEYAAESYRRALAAQEECAFSAEIVSVTVRERRGETVVDRDEEPRPTTTADLARLRPAFEKEGTVTAGNASTLADGAAAVVIVAAEEAERRRLKPLARILASATFSREPEWIMMAPVGAIQRVAERAGVALQEIDLFEINEPFSAATLGIIDELKLDAERVNVHGGAVALGHPVGATGCRLMVTLIHALQRYEKRLGLASLCLGGGEAVAIILERVE